MCWNPVVIDLDGDGEKIVFAAGYAGDYAPGCAQWKGLFGSF